MLGGQWALLILDMIGGGALIAAAIALWHRGARHRKQRLWPTDPVLKERLAEIAQGWARLAADYANFRDRTAQWSDRAKRTA
jgi:hypothetical protein